MGKGEHTFSKNDLWCTSQVVWGPLVRHFGGIGFDPCSNPRSGVPARCRVIFGAASWLQLALRTQYPAVEWLFADGLRVPWTSRGLVFVNGPFSNLTPWSERIASKEADELVFLGPLRLGASYYQDHLLPSADARCFIRRSGAGGKIYEVAAGVAPKHAPPWHSILLYAGDRPDVFDVAYSHLGRVEITR